MYFFMKGVSLLKDSLGKCYLVDTAARIALHSANKYCNELLGGKVLRFDPNTKWVFETLVRTGVVGSGWTDTIYIRKSLLTSACLHASAREAKHNKDVYEKGVTPRVSLTVFENQICVFQKCRSCSLCFSLVLLLNCSKSIPFKLLAI